jgi:hypothetical protein
MRDRNIEYSKNPCGSAIFFIDAIASRAASDAVARRASGPKKPRADSESRILATKLFFGEFAFRATPARHDGFFDGPQRL